MKILFLDIDGVLLAGRHWNSIEDCTHDTVPSDTTFLLNEVIRRTGALVVVSSTWRLDNFCRQHLVKGSFCGKFHRYWRTPFIGPTRGREIEQWLKDHPETKTYAILDDNSDMLPEQLPFFVQTQFETGLTEEHVERLVTIMNQ